MKRIIAFLSVAVLMAASVSVSAQGKYGRDSAECVKYLSFYKQYMSQKNMKEAAPQWRKAFSICPPTASQNMLIDGLKIIRADIVPNKNNPARVRELVDTMMMIHKMRIENYPKFTVQAYSAMSLDMINFMANNDPMEVFEALDVAINITNEKTPVTVPVRYLDFATVLYRNGKIDAERVIASYEKACVALDKVMAAAADDKTKEDVKGAKAGVDQIFSASGVATCENLVAIYTPKYESSPDDKALLASMVSSMSKQNCVSEPLFRQAVESLHKQEATYNSAYFLFKLYASAGDDEKAAEFMQEAIAYPESDAATDALYYFELAQFHLKDGRNGEAFKAAKSAAALAEQAGDQALLGKCYYVCGQIWGSVKCHGNEVEVRAPYWVAVDYLIRARNANGDLAEDANKLIGAYSSYFPAQSEAFMYDVIDGSSYTVECGGMRETTKVRTQK